MIWLQKDITVGKTLIPAGTILNDKYQTGICYYKGTKVNFTRDVPSDAIYVPGTPKEMIPGLPSNDESTGTIKRIAVRSILDSPIIYDKVYDPSNKRRLTIPACMLRPSIEAKHIGDIVDVVDYDYDMPGHSVVVKHGRLQELGRFGSLKDKIRNDSKRAYDELAEFCKTGHETVWKVDGAWFCHANQKYGLESGAMKIVASDTPNTDVIMFNDTPVATIISKELIKNSYPDTGYVNDEDHKISILNNNGEPIELKCLDDDVVMEQTIIDELTPIITAIENLQYLQIIDSSGYANSQEKLEVVAFIAEIERAFNNIDVNAEDFAVTICDSLDDTAWLVSISLDTKLVSVTGSDVEAIDYIRNVIRKQLPSFNFAPIKR